MTDTCNCCEGVAPQTPAAIVNRPGLDRLAYRVGTHATFFETMRSRLSSPEYAALAALRARDASDPSFAMLDAWSMVADVLTFYQERIANEGYLRCATERRSVLELARLVGYALRPGVAASTYLAFTLEDGYDGHVPAGTRAQSLPGPGELPQPFETSDEIEARAAWNVLRPRTSRPQYVTAANAGALDTLYVAGTSANLKPNDGLLVVAGGTRQFRRVVSAIADAAANRTKVTLDAPAVATRFLRSDVERRAPGDVISRAPLDAAMQRVFARPSTPPSSSFSLARRAADAFGEESDANPQLVSAMHPDGRQAIYTVLKNAPGPAATDAKVYVFRERAALFGHNAPPVPAKDTLAATPPTTAGSDPAPNEAAEFLWLDAVYDRIVPNTDMVLQLDGAAPSVLQAKAVDVVSRSDYGVAGRVTRIQFAAGEAASPDARAHRSRARAHRARVSTGEELWPTKTDFDVIRRATVYAAPEELTLAEEQISSPDIGGHSTEIELDGLYDGLKSGRWLIVTGERTDIGAAANQPIPGIVATELAMVAGARQDVHHIVEADGAALPGDRLHTWITLANKLAYTYKRDTVTFRGNVAKATHGEGRREACGSGGSKPLQTFALRQPPLTYVASAATPAGAASTLRLYVDGVLWHQTDTLAGASPTAREYVTRTGDDDTVTIVTGSGEQGARASGSVTAEYRSGIGRAGNVAACRISLLATHPLGVKSVVNPLPATGGADRDGMDQARRNAPLAVTALDRLVSVQDHADFARTFAGVAKASAARLSDGRREIVHVTISGVDDVFIDETSDLWQSLRRALRDYGDPSLHVVLARRTLKLLLLSANVRISPDYLWDNVAPAIRTELLRAFGYESRDLVQSTFESEVLAVIQRVPGVAYVDVDVFGGVSELGTGGGVAGPSEIAASIDAVVKQRKGKGCGYVEARLARASGGTLLAAELAYFTPSVPDTIILTEIKP